MVEITMKLDKKHTFLPTLRIQMNNKWRKAESMSESEGVVLWQFRPTM